MSGKFRFTRNERAFLRKNEQLKDIVLANMSMDIEIKIKTGGRTPVKTGAMKADVRHRKKSQGVYTVEARKEYSIVQELGRRAGAATFRNYSTSGTGPGWFISAIESVHRDKANYFHKAARSVRI